MNQSILFAVTQLTGRVLMSSIFIMAGINKVTGYAGTQGYMKSMGIPGALPPLVILLEIGGGLTVLSGWQTRIAVFLLARFSVLSAMIFHADFGDQVHFIYEEPCDGRRSTVNNPGGDGCTGTGPGAGICGLSPVS